MLVHLFLEMIVKAKLQNIQFPIATIVVKITKQKKEYISLEYSTFK